MHGWLSRLGRHWPPPSYEMPPFLKVQGERFDFVVERRSKLSKIYLRRRKGEKTYE